MVLDPILIVNLLLCAIILIFGVVGYKRTGRILPLLVGVAFGLFGVSHLATLFGYKDALETPLSVVRTLGYLTVTFTLSLAALGPKPKH